jgi:hypothetical protein
MDMVTKSLTAEQIAHLQAMPKTAAAHIAQPPVAPPQFVSGKDARELTVILDFPVIFDGATITEVTIRRPVQREWRAYTRACAEAVRAGGPGADDLVDQPWLSIPAIVVENLDIIDGARLEAVMQGFLGRSELPDETESPSSSTSPSGQS